MPLERDDIEGHRWKDDVKKRIVDDTPWDTQGDNGVNVL